MSNIVKFQSSYLEPYPLQVQGESFYKKNIEGVSNYMGDDEGVNVDDLIGQLVLDDANIYDTGNAVRVEIDGKIVGYLAKPVAKLYRQKLAELGIPKVIGQCYASIRGGFIKKDGEQADFGVRLDLDLNNLIIEPERRPPAQAAPLQSQPPTASSPSVPIKSSSRKKIRCPKCGSENVSVQAVTDIKTKHRSCLGWCWWLLLAICTLGLILIIPILTNSKTKSKTHTEALCQDCGHRWKV
jgi:hypothetical protein